MSYSVEGNKIIMTRGDTAKVHITIKYRGSGEPYEPQPGDSIRFSLKRYLYNKTPVLEKDIPIDTMYLILESDDTKSLPFGIYHFDIQLIYANGDVDTFIEDGILELSYEVG